MGAVSSLGVGSAERAESSDAGRLGLVFRKLMQEQVELMVIQIVPKVIIPKMEDLVRKVVKEEIKSATENILAGGIRTNRNTVTVTNERKLCLRFSDEVSEKVLTGQEIKGKGGLPMRVALVDKDTGDVIESGQGSSAKVEVSFLEAGEGNENIESQQDFSNRIIPQSDKKKPHFAKVCHVYLEKGIGVLKNAKLANPSDWTKVCKCRLGAQVVDNLNGLKVQEAWTEPFLVSDSRRELNKKPEMPSLSDHVSRLNQIGKDGPPCKRLEEKKIKTVEQFLFLLNVHPQKLREILSVRDKTWKASVKHARTCIIDDKNIYMHNDSSEGNMSVLFDAVGNLKGVLLNSQYVTEHCLSEDEKVSADKLLRSAFENWKDRCDRTSFSDEATLVQRFPRQEGSDARIASIQEDSPVIASFENGDHGDPTEAVDSGQSKSASIEEHFHDLDTTMSENINHDVPSEPGPLTSSQRWSPSIEQSGNVNNTLVHEVPCQANYAVVPGHDSTRFQGVSNQCNPTEPDNSAQSISPSIGTSGDANGYYHQIPPVSTHFELPDTNVYDGPLYSPDHCYYGMIFENCVGNGFNETRGDEFHSCQQINACSIFLLGSIAIHWKFLAIKKRKNALGLRVMDVAKRQRTE